MKPKNLLGYRVDVESVNSGEVDVDSRTLVRKRKVARVNDHDATECNQTEFVTIDLR